MSVRSDDPSIGGRRRQFKLLARSRPWTRFSFHGTIKRDQSYFPWILPAVSTTRIWLDALQIEEGELSEFHPTALELAASTTAPYNTYWIGDRCAVVARLYPENRRSGSLVHPGHAEVPG